MYEIILPRDSIYETSIKHSVCRSGMKIQYSKKFTKKTFKNPNKKKWSRQKEPKWSDTRFDTVASKRERNKILSAYNFPERYCPNKSKRFFHTNMYLHVTIPMTAISHDFFFSAEKCAFSHTHIGRISRIFFDVTHSLFFIF